MIPFTSQDSWVSKGYNATFLQFWLRNKLIYILDDLGEYIFSKCSILGVNCSFKVQFFLLFITQNASFISHCVGYCALRQVSGPLPLNHLIPTEWLQAELWPSWIRPFYGSSVGKRSFRRGLVCVWVCSAVFVLKGEVNSLFSFPVCCLCYSWSVKSICAGERQYRQMCSDRWGIELGISCHFCWLE